MNEMQEKVLAAIQKKEKELAKLREREKLINKKLAEKVKKEEEIRVKRIGRMLDEILQKKFGSQYFERMSEKEISDYFNQMIEAQENVLQPQDILKPDVSVKPERIEE